jgi:hypothetical protein
MEETIEFEKWWNSHFDPNETGCRRALASFAFAAGMTKAREIDDRDRAEEQMLQAEAGH